ncbi:FG-GAP-like repeat-containing protein [Oligoflexaceae bacterium]|nr:FG-GAP-like repeat-containing protein [Oligoflexaceae bacterium]
MRTIFIVSLMTIYSCSGDAKFGTGSAQKTDEEVIVGEDAQFENVPTFECFKKPSVLPKQTLEPELLFDWNYGAETYNQVMATPAVAEFKTGEPRIIFSAFSPTESYRKAAKTIAIDGKTGETVWTSDIEVSSRTTPALGDINGDGKIEVVVSGFDEYLYALDDEGTQIWKSESTGLSTSGATLADLDGDGETEIIVGENVFTSAGKDKFKISGDGQAIRDIRSEEGLEIVSAVGIYSGLDGKEFCRFVAPPEGFEYREASIAVGKLVEKSSHSSVVMIDFPLEVTDPTGSKTALELADERFEKITHVYIFNADTCAKERQFEVPYEGTGRKAGGGPVNLADIDGDGDLEIAFAGRHYYTVFEADGTLIWKNPTQDFSSAATGSSSFDFNGDGKLELVYNDEQFLRVFNGQTGAVVYEYANISGTLVEYPVIADVNADGHANVVVAANNYGNRDGVTGIRVFKGKDNLWTKTRKLWNQYSYIPSLINDDYTFSNGSEDESDAVSSQRIGFRNNTAIIKFDDPVLCE